MKRNINVAMLLVVTLMISLLAFTACGNNNSENGDKQVPVYQGMTITKVDSAIKLTSASCYSSGIVLLSSNNGNNGDNGNHYGHYKGDHTDRNDTIDEDNPYPDNNANENIEEEIKSSLNVVGSPDEIYYATPNEDIYINIHIDNPDSFEIMSFTLNGKKYSSYMFEEGSDMETIVLKYNVGDATGIVEYTIDAIKYIDGTEIKDVIIDGNKTVMAGIRTENQVVASVTDVDIDTNVLSFNVNVKDNNSLVEFSKGALKAVIYDGFNIISEKDIAVGNNSVIFDGLKTNTVYQYAVVGYYDDLSGGGFGMNVLYKDAFYTDSVVLFDNITVGQESISFGYLWHEDHQGKAISVLKLYKDDAFIKDITASATTVNELLSGTTYKLVAEYPNADKTESIYLEFATLAKATPEVSVFNPIKTQTSVGFEIVETDADNVGTVTKIELYKDGQLVETAANLDVRSFDGLLSNNTYTVKITYTYNLNDGAGNQTTEKNLDIKTDAKATPVVSITNPTQAQTSVGFEISETDADNIGSVTKIELVHADGTLVADSLDQRAFANLLSNNEYTVKVTYVYDLNDGEGEHTVTKELVITTDAKTTPDFTISNTGKTQTSLSFTVTVTDNDSVGSIAKVELIHGADVTTLSNATAHEIEALLSNNDYTIKVTYAYNLNDGVGDKTLVKELTAKTEAKTVPSFDVKNKSITTTGINAEYEIADIDNILSSYKIELYKGATLVSENADKKISFASLDYYTDYTLKITYTYDLNDGNGVQSAVFENSYKTLPFIDITECSIANTSAVSEGDTIFMSVKLDNPLGMSIESVVINGETYSVTGASTKNKIFVEIVYNGQFAGGDTYLKIDKVNAKLDNAPFIVEPKSELSDNVFINGKLEVLKIEFVNEDFEPIDWAFPSETVYILITLNNSTGYTINLVEINKGAMEEDAVSNLTKIDNNRWYLQASSYYNDFGLNHADLDTISYSNEYINEKLSCSIRATIYRVLSDEIQYISTPNDLKKMNDGYYYELSNDIDLSGLEWVGENFDGVFDGMGYSIKNMSFVGSVSNTSAYFGLFNGAKGILQNLNIENATIVADVTSNDNRQYYVTAGAFAARSSDLLIKNCTVDNNSIISVKNHTCSDGSWDYIGGFVGETDNYTRIIQCVNYGTVYGLNEVGGFVGAASGTTIINSINYGSISSERSAGGLFGDANGYTVIANCFNVGDITAQDYCGGLGVVGNIGANITIENCFNSGVLNGNGSIDALIYLIYFPTLNIDNSYSLTLYNGINGEVCTIEKLNTKSFYTETLGWSEDIWDLSELDVENGKFPKLKQIL